MSRRFSDSISAAEFREELFGRAEKAPAAGWGSRIPGSPPPGSALQTFAGEKVVSGRNRVVVYEGQPLLSAKTPSPPAGNRGTLGCSIAPGAASLGAEPEQPVAVGDALPGNARSRSV